MNRSQQLSWNLQQSRDSSDSITRERTQADELVPWADEGSAPRLSTGRAWKGAGGTALRALLTILALLPPMRFAWLVNKYGVSVPKRDDWDVAMLIAQAHQGSLRFADLLSQQQEGRTVIPKLAFIATTLSGRWDVRDLMWLSFIICLLTTAGILWLLRRNGLSVTAAGMCLIIASALIFAPAQDEVIGFGFGFPSFLPALFIVAALLALGAEIATGAKFVICAVLATASSFTLPHGLLTWGLTFPLLLLEHRKPVSWKWMIGWLLACAACVALYFYGYAKPRDLPTFAPSSVTLSDYLFFVIGFIGGAWARATPENLATAAVAGTILTSIFAVAIAAIVRTRDRALWRQAGPWVALGLYSLGSGVLAAFGRIGYGVVYCLSSRYVTFSIYVCIADAALLALLIKRRGTASRRLAPVLWATLAAALLLYTRASASAIDRLRHTSARDRLARAALQMNGALDTSRAIDRTLYPGGGCVRQVAPLLDGYGLFRPQLVRTRRINLLNYKTADGRAAAGFWEKTQYGRGGICHATGWAALPRKSRPADCVVLGYSTRAGDCTAFAMSDAVWTRRDVAEHFGTPGNPCNDQLWTGWTVDFARNSVQSGATISAWAMDTDDLKFYRLGEVNRASEL